jgi:predicted dehydrogenase
MINWGILGTGFMATMFAEDFQYVKDGKIYAVASRSQEKATHFSEKFNIEKAYEGYENLVKDKNIDVIYIATPHSAHYENILLSLEHNKAVVCEKPITVNTDQLDEVIHIAKEKDLFLMEAMWTYFLPPVIMAKKWCDEGKIGEIQLIKAFFGNNAKASKHGRLFDPHLAGGALLDLGIYPVALSQMLMDCSLVNVHAEGKLGETGVDEFNAAILKYKKGALSIIGSSLTSSLQNDAYIYGSEGYIYIPDFFKARMAYLYCSEGDDVFEDERDSRGFHYEADEVNRLLKEGEKESPRISHKKSLCNMCTLDTIRERLKVRYPFEKQKT